MVLVGSKKKIVAHPNFPVFIAGPVSFGNFWENIFHGSELA